MKCLLTLLLLLPVWVPAQTDYLKIYLKNQRKSYKLIGNTVDLEVKTLDNQTFSLADLKGKIVVMDLWYGNCGPCFRQLPYLDTIKQYFKDDTTLVFINLCSETSDSVWRKRIDDFEISGIHLLHPNKTRTRGEKSVPQLFNQEGFPSYIFLDMNARLLGATHVKPVSKILFAFYIECIKNGLTLQQAEDLFAHELSASRPSAAFHHFLTEKLGIKEGDIEKETAIYRPFFKK